MLHIKSLIVSFVFVLVSVFSYGQDNVVLHTDKPYYVPGEIMWYKVYLPQEFSSQAMSFKVIISDSKGQKIDSYFLDNNSDQLSGHYRVPFGTNSGYYGITFAALDQNSLEQKLFVQFEIPIYNDLETSEEMPSEIASATGSLGSDISLKFNKESYTPGESVQLGITASEKIKDYSISIVDLDLVGSDLMAGGVQNGNINVGEYSNASFGKGHYVQGTVLTKEGQPKKINQLGVYNGSANEMHLARANNNGQFTLVLPETSGKKAYQFAGYVSNEAQDINVTLNPDASPAITKTLGINDDVKNYLQMSKVRKKIYQYYETLEYDLPKMKENMTKKEVKADKTYDMSEYVQFNSIGKFFDEIISSPLQFEILEDGSVKALMYDSEGFKRYNTLGAKDNFIFDPLFIVNGKLTRDARYIYTLPLEEIGTVELYTSRKSLAKMVGNFRNYGIAVINSTNPSLTVPISDEKGIKEVNALQVPASFEEMTSLQLDMPQLRPLVYWNQNISDGTGISKPLVIKSSDDVSTFQVTVVARTESGKVISGSSTYSTSLVKG